jgi:periplasmic divalent cation tolerance protein
MKRSPFTSETSMDDQLVVVLTTLPASHDAPALARTLVGEHLAACVNVLPPMLSTYRWEGRVQQEPEQQLVIKTTRTRVGGLQHRLTALHPYDVPEFLVLSVADASKAYGSWLRESVDAR